ncbi:hypothetical protein AB3N59_05185 [Leptospira sp. WS92.C1]
MNPKAEEEFIKRAEELNARLGSGALRSTEKFLNPQHWLDTCETTSEFYIEFYDLLQRTLRFQITHNQEERPGMLDFLLTTDLESRFPPIDINSETFARITATIRYILAKVLARQISKKDDFSDLVPFAKAAFGALWALPGSAEISSRDRWQAYEVLLDLAFGNYEQLIKVYDKEYGFELAKHENSNRMMMKECYMLSRIAAGGSYDDWAFGVAAYIPLLKLNHYLWLVNDDRSAEIDLIPLAVICQLYDKITGANVANRRDFYSSMEPRVVLEDMHSVERA